MTWIILAAALLILGYNGGVLLYRLGRRDEAREWARELELWKAAYFGITTQYDSDPERADNVIPMRRRWIG